jgi:AraC-like DNA-binding protein
MNSNTLPKNLTHQEVISTVQVSIDHGNIVKIVHFLINNQIPFSISADFSQPVLHATCSPNTKIQVNSNHSGHTPLISSDTTVSLLDSIIEKYFSDNFDKPLPKTSVIAEEFGLNSFKLKSLFVKHYNKSMTQFYMEKRMEYAAKLLKKGLKASEVTHLIGYGEHSAIKFNKMFQKHFGMTPKKYQMQHYGTLNKRINKKF